MVAGAGSSIVCEKTAWLPHLSALDRFLFGFWSLFLDPRRLQRADVIIRPSTLLKFHDLLKNRKYRLLYSSVRKGKPGPKGPSSEPIQAIIEPKQRNPRFGCLRLAQQINKAFGVDINKDLVRHVLAKHYRPIPDGNGPSWQANLRILEIKNIKSIPSTPISHPLMLAASINHQPQNSATIYGFNGPDLFEIPEQGSNEPGLATLPIQPAGFRYKTPSGGRVRQSE